MTPHAAAPQDAGSRGAGLVKGDSVGGVVRGVVSADEASVVTAASLSRIGRSKPTITSFRPIEESMRQAHGSQYVR
jgi:hypothetical protein